MVTNTAALRFSREHENRKPEHPMTKEPPSTATASEPIEGEGSSDAPAELALDASGVPASSSHAANAPVSSASTPDAPGVSSEFERAQGEVRASRRRCRIAFFVLVVALVVIFFVSFMIGRYPIDPPDLVRFLFDKATGSDTEWPREYNVVVFTIRLPRVLAAALVGACLSIAGLSFQALFKNPMASPDLLGASSGAAFGAAITIFYHLSSTVTSLAAFACGLVAVLLAWAIGQRMRHDRMLGMILAGIMIGSLFEAGVSVLKLVADVDETLPAITYWLMGSVSSVKMDDLGPALIPMLAGTVGLLLMRGRLNVLGLGDDEARSLGINTGLCRGIVIVCATLVTSASVSISGIIGWVGLVIPHFARMIVGENQRWLMPSTLVLGAAFLVAVDDLARSVATIDIPLGIITAFVGAPFFIFLALRKEAR